MSVCISAGDCARQLIHVAEMKGAVGGGHSVEGQGIGVPLPVPMDLYHQKSGKTWAVLEVPGARRDQIEVTLNEQQSLLTISGRLERPACERQDGEFLYRGARFGPFVRELQLPRGTKESDIKARYDNGILQVEIPDSKGSKGDGVKVQFEA